MDKLMTKLKRNYPNGSYFVICGKDSGRWSICARQPKFETTFCKKYQVSNAGTFVGDATVTEIE